MIVALLAPAIIPWVLRWREQAIARELQEVNLALSALEVAAVVTVAGLTRREQRARPRNRRCGRAT